MRILRIAAPWRFGDWVALVFAVLASLWLASPYLFPASQWIELHSVTVSDAVAGEEIMLSVDRSLHRGTENGRYEVTVHEYETNIPMCTAKRAVPYRAETVITPLEPVTLKWWAYSEDGECDRWEPEPGRYYVATKHCWRGVTLARESCNPWTVSNVFTVRAVEGYNHLKSGGPIRSQ